MKKLVAILMTILMLLYGSFKRRNGKRRQPIWPMSRGKYSERLKLADNTSYSGNQKNFNFITA